MKLLLIRLEGALQSWGEWAKWDERDSSLMPTKSGVIGLIACCMGLKRGDPLIEQMHRKLQFAVRGDRPGEIMTDFHTVHSNTMKTADGTVQDRTIVSHRQYLMDSAFLAVISVWNPMDELMLDRCAEALQHPKWVPFLGRKSCVPSAPLFYGCVTEYTSPEEALQKIPLLVRHGKNPSDTILIRCESKSFGSRHPDALTDGANRAFTMNMYEHFPYVQEG
ncbi:MAG: type I-E CRISPR-associated protein Cas5/CasD [Clostridia bacterium]|nr:type I-E CRISPR-associated protein Cas5/CasD [Clostridia bacterium]